MEFLAYFNSVISNNIFLAIILSFFAGVVASFSPCTLSSIPLLIGYVQGSEVKDNKKAFKYSLIFSIGLGITFTVIGLLTALIGKAFLGAGKFWYIILAFIMIGSGLQVLDVINLFGDKKDACKITKRREGILDAFFLGILSGILAYPCATPIMAAIIAFIAASGNLVIGMIMLLMYSLGHSVLIILAGTSFGLVEKIAYSENGKKIGRVLKNILGTIIILVGLYLFYLGV
ncbi:TPA: cytochrome c biogenesis protein CcdA [Clostridium perfringens]|nr:cytochrome c biogenesis protein CcdA [Clostridium perfringens]HBI7111654.1 cytochrome c biogenesis protein CcdA [Clostridium perfringens]HBI7116742.1 cytochrome c biogenesis protein CcdA [Clostridium perfringens]HBI7122885.1 cytochrome c biogenesis protein CcdA [Clostridium perfringens]